MKNTIKFIKVGMTFNLLFLSLILNSQSFNCGNIFTDPRDGQVYSTVKIGEQCWMEQNLRATKLNDGTAIPNITDNTGWANLTTQAYCWYNNDESNKNTYGALYNWYTVNSGKLCIDGWHVATHDDWTNLELDICSSGTCNTDFPFDTITAGWRGSDEGGKLKESGTSHWASPNTGATNSSGLTLLPGGYRSYTYGTFGFMTSRGYWWTATEGFNKSYAWSRYLYNNNASVGRYNKGGYKSYGFSVRCVADNSNSGINENDKSGFQIKIFPNPVDEMLEFKYNSASNVHFSLNLLDATGRIIYSANESQKQINTSNIPNGIYILKVIGDTFIDSRKIVVKH